jgi:hypothetical protein
MIWAVVRSTNIGADGENSYKKPPWMPPGSESISLDCRPLGGEFICIGFVVYLTVNLECLTNHQ